MLHLQVKRLFDAFMLLIGAVDGRTTWHCSVFTLQQLATIWLATWRPADRSPQPAG